MIGIYEQILERNEAAQVLRVLGIRNPTQEEITEAVAILKNIDQMPILL